MNQKIYLDAAASSIPDPLVLQDITNSLIDDWHNPSSICASGREVRQKIDHAREQVRKFINAGEKDKIIFTSSATESNNIAVQGFIKANHPNKTIMLYDYMNHPSLENIKDFINFNHENNLLNCFYAPVFNDEYGRMKLESLKTYFERLEYCNLFKNNDYYVLIPILHTNNEIGVINNIKAISNFLIHEHGGYVLVDFAQGAAHSPINVQEDGIDMLTFTSEKIGMPRGCGVLYIRDGIDIDAIIYGGGQEQGLRSGTENQAMIIALGNQCERIQKKLESREIQEIESLLYEVLRNNIHYACHDVCEYVVNNRTVKEPVNYAPNILSVQFKGYNNQQLLTMLDENGVECSAGSACSSGDAKPSRVLQSIGLSDEEINSTLRFSFDYRLTVTEVKEFGKILRKCLIALKGE